MNQTQQKPWRVLLLGAGGQLGQCLQQSLPSNIALYVYTRQALDITQKAHVQAVIEKDKPQLVINAAAYNAVDQAERMPQTAHEVNHQAVAQLAELTALKKIPVLHLSTDYVFGGAEQKTPYHEQDLPAPLNAYGESKLAGEKALLEINPQAWVVRTSSLFSPYGDNFVTHILKQALKGEGLRVVEDQLSCPTAATDLALMLWQLALLILKGELTGQSRESKNTHGVLHYAGDEVLSRYTWAQKIIAIAVEEGLLTNAVHIIPCLMKDFPTPAQRPSYSALCSQLAQSRFSIAPSNWQKACRDMCGDIGRALKR